MHQPLRLNGSLDKPPKPTVPPTSWPDEISPFVRERLAYLLDPSVTPPPPLPGGHRSYNKSTILSQLMVAQHLRCHHVHRMTGVHERTLTNVLNRSAAPSVRVIAKLSDFFSVDPIDIVDESGYLRLAPVAINDKSDA